MTSCHIHRCCLCSRGDYKQSLCSRSGNLESCPRILPPTLGKAQFCFLKPSACSNHRGHLDPHHTEDSQMSISQQPGLVLNWVILMFADPPASLSWSLHAFSDLIASIHNHRSRRAKAPRAREEQAGGSRALNFQCLPAVSFLGSEANGFNHCGASNHCRL